MKRVLVSSREIPSCLIHTSMESSKVRGQVNRKKYIWSNNAPNFSKFYENYWPKIHKAEQPTSTRNMKKNTSWHITIKLFETSGKEENLTRSQRQRGILYTGEQREELQPTLHWIQCKCEDTGAASIKQW